MPRAIPPTGKEQTIAPVRPNAGVTAAYLRWLGDLVRAMSDEVETVIESHYSRAEKRIAQDDSPLNDLKSAMSGLARKWQKRFNEEAPDQAKRFINETARHGTRTAQARMKAAGMTIKFTPTRRMQDVLTAAVAENTKLIKSISAEYLDDVAGIVNRGVMAGRDRGQIAQELRARYGVTKRRAALIATQENRNVTTAMNRERDLSLGLEEAYWVHSGGGREPRESHVKAGRERLRFRIAEGAFIDGKWIMPGQEINCGCSYRPILKGWND